MLLTVRAVAACACACRARAPVPTAGRDRGRAVHLFDNFAIAYVTAAPRPASYRVRALDAYGVHASGALVADGVAPEPPSSDLTHGGSRQACGWGIATLVDETKRRRAGLRRRTSAGGHTGKSN